MIRFWRDGPLVRVLMPLVFVAIAGIVRVALWLKPSRDHRLRSFILEVF